VSEPGSTFDARRAVRALREADPVWAQVIAQVGPCRLEPARWSPFEALLRSIVYQQLSGRAAATIFGRVKALFGRRAPSAKALLVLPDEALRGAGLSRNKALAVRDLAARVLDGTVPDAQEIQRLPDAEIVSRVTLIRGVGEWTAQMLLIFNLGRPDVLPTADLGIQKGLAKAWGLRRLPAPKQVARRGEAWRPHRTVASWYLWRVLELPPGPLGA
jgi:DNA-3-methyladenine glycosylase II